MLSAEKISHTYQGQAVLKDINITVKTGEIVVLLGTSGTGKTTLLRILGGLLQPSSGQVSFNETPVDGPSKRLIPGHPHISYVAQHHELLPMLTAKANIAQGVTHLMPEQQNEIVADLVRLFKLDEVQSQPLRSLSGGQQQRVALAKKLAAGGTLFLFDEVFSQLDLTTKTHVMLALKRFIKEKGKSAVFVLHDPVDTFLLADRVLVLEGGALVQNDTPYNVYNYPATITTAQLLGLVNVVPENAVKSIWPQKEFYIVQNQAIIRPTDIYKHELPIEANIIGEVDLPGSRFLEVELRGHTFLVHL